MTAGFYADGVFMAIPNDPVILLSYINTMLRDKYDSLEELCKSLSLDEKELCDKLASIGYNYDAEQKRFR